MSAHLNETETDRHFSLFFLRSQNSLRHSGATVPAEHRLQVHKCFGWHSLCSPQVPCLQSSREGKEIVYKDKAFSGGMNCDKKDFFPPSFSKRLSSHVMHIQQISSHVLLLLYKNIMGKGCGGISDVLYNWKHGFIIFVGIYSTLHEASAAS